MNKTVTTFDEQLEARLNEAVERFEDARDRSHTVDVAEFMPNPSDPDYATIGVELGDSIQGARGDRMV